jgi:hypothetical protein
MGTPLFAAHFLFGPLQWLARRAGRSIAAARGRKETAAPTARVAHATASPRPPAPAHAARTPRTARLRVVRVFEGPQAAAGAGRMVISGRMADVCAELERLAALETAAG